MSILSEEDLIQHHLDSAEAGKDDAIMLAMANAQRAGYTWLLDSGTFNNIWGTCSFDDLSDRQQAKPIVVNGASGPMTLNETGMLELPDGTKARGYLNTHMSINLICEDWLVEEKGWDITHGRDQEVHYAYCSLHG